MAHLLKQVEGLAKGEGVSFCLTSLFPFAFHLEGIYFVGALWSVHGRWCPRFAHKGSSCCLYYPHHYWLAWFQEKKECAAEVHHFVLFLPGTSAADSVPLLLPPIPSHPWGRVQLQGVNTAELSKTHMLWHRCQIQVGGQGSSKPSQEELSPNQATAKSSVSEWSGPEQMALCGAKPVQHSGRGQHCEEQSKSRMHGAVWTIWLFGGLSPKLKLGEGEH